MIVYFWHFPFNIFGGCLYNPCPHTGKHSPVTFCIRVVHLLQLVNLHGHIIITQSSEFGVYIMVHTWYYTLNMYLPKCTVTHVHLWYHRAFSRPSEPSMFCLFTPPFRMSCSWNRTAHSLLNNIGFFHLVICLLDSSMSFQGLMAHFFFAQNIPFFNFFYCSSSIVISIFPSPLFPTPPTPRILHFKKCTTVYLSIHLLKAILVAFKFWQL